ncbi:hypothetical protein JET18_07415 [Chryseobacterium sp. L7]|uniref:DUF4156 domain-containing protein n=1 Tax=Chryseobacterium endalhagicum TaxID=2797638 RepID=A0ABS1QEC0_9FLAO|nr:hypothetical protein [Chryseobacterium endalhagicum]MBL1220661.1 hypothetical protein [Chryseobacterium endalhagicum]
MKKLFIQSIGILALSAATSCAPSYFGKTYAPTQNVDVYFDAADVKRQHEVMGTTDVGQGFNSLNAVQQKVIELGKAQGADGVVMKLTEEVTGSQKSDFGNMKNGSKNSTYTGGSITTNMKTKKVQATFIKYK